MSVKPTNIRWLIFLVLAIASFTSYVLRYNVSAAAPVMIGDLGVSELQWGWVLAAFATGYAIFQFPGGIFGDKAGPRRALTVIAALWFVFTVLTVVIPGPERFGVGVTLASLMLVRFLVGVVHAPIFPVLNTAIGRWFPVGSWALPLGLSSTALTLGAAAAAAFLPWLTFQYGWRMSFLIISPIGAFVAGLWWWYAKDDPRDHPEINAAEVALITADQSPPVLTPIDPPGWLRVLKNRNILLLTLSYTCANYVFYDVFNWFLYYLVQERGFSLEIAGAGNSLQWIAGGAGAAIGGWLCTRLCASLGLRWGCRWPIVIGLLACAVMLVAGALHSSPTVSIVLLAMCFFFHQLTEGAYWASSIAIGNQLAGAAGGVLNTGANLMGILNALMVPWFAQMFGWTFAIASGAIFAVIGAVLLFFVRSDERMVLD